MNLNIFIVYEIIKALLLLLMNLHRTNKEDKMKNRFWKSIAIGIGSTTFALAFTLLGKTDVHAATPATNITQTGGSSSSINVEWTGALDDSKYSVQMSE